MNEFNKIPETTPETTTPETKSETTKTEKCRDFGSLQWGFPTNTIKRKSVLELRREFGDNWV